MRVYEKVQRRLSRRKERKEYCYKVEAGEVERCSDWVLAGVVFNDADEERMDDGRLVQFYVYHFREGFQRISLTSTIQDNSFTILLEFKLAETEKKIPDFHDGGDYFFSHIVEIIRQNFDNKFYEDEARDLYKLVEMIDWDGESAILKAVRKKSLLAIIIGFVASAASFVWKGIWRTKA